MVVSQHDVIPLPLPVELAALDAQWEGLLLKLL